MALKSIMFVQYQNVGKTQSPASPQQSSLVPRHQIFQVCDQKLEAGTAWERGHLGSQIDEVIMCAQSSMELDPGTQVSQATPLCEGY